MILSAKAVDAMVTQNTVATNQIVVCALIPIFLPSQKFTLCPMIIEKPDKSAIRVEARYDRPNLRP